VKKLILITLLFFSIDCYAGFELRLTGGIVTNSVPGITVNDGQSMLNYAASLKFAYNLPLFQVGAGIDVIKLGAKRDDVDWKLSYANPGIPVYGFINRRHSLLKLDFYYGLSAGYFFCASDQKGNFHGGETTFYKSKGPTAGAQLGLTLKFPGKLGVNVEAAAKYARLSFEQPAIPAYLKFEEESYDIFYFPVMVGISYRL
jgi:hypothetical protein